MDDILTMTFLVTVTLRQKRQWDDNVRKRKGEKIILLNNVALRAGQLAAKPAPLGPGLPGCSFLKATVYMDKDYEGFAFQPIPSQTGRFENGPGGPGPRPTLVKKITSLRHRPSHFLLWPFW